MQTAPKLRPAVAPGTAAVLSFMERKYPERSITSKSVYLQWFVTLLNEILNVILKIANCTAVKVICVMVPHRNTNGQRHAMP